VFVVHNREAFLQVHRVQHADGTIIHSSGTNSLLKGILHRHGITCQTTGF